MKSFKQHIAEAYSSDANAEFARRNSRAAAVSRAVGSKKGAGTEHSSHTKVGKSTVTIGKSGDRHQIFVDKGDGSKASSSSAVKDAKAAHKHVVSRMKKGDNVSNIFMDMHKKF